MEKSSAQSSDCIADSSNLFHFIMNFLRGPLVVVLQIRIRLDLQHSLNYFLDLDQSFKFGLRSQFWFVEN